MKALIELKYIRDYHPEVVNKKLIDEAIAELEALNEEIKGLKKLIRQMKCCENCEFYPNTECGFNTQYGCLDGTVPSNWKLKKTK